jgi:DNA-binding XRE family transcriptional regulator
MSQREVDKIPLTVRLLVNKIPAQYGLHCEKSVLVVRSVPQPKKESKEEVSMAEKSFGRIVEERRHELGLTQEMVAKKVNVKANYIGYLERGMRHPSQKVVEKLSGALKLDAQELYLMANPKVRNLLGTAKGGGGGGASSGLQQLLKDSAAQKSAGISAGERGALAQLDRANSAASAAKAVQALRSALGK